MIVFDLQCECGYQFEGWFESREDYEKQRSGNIIACPSCDGVAIHKILSPVAIHSCTLASEKQSPQENQSEMTSEITLKLLRTVHDYVEKNFEDVGAKLATESLKIHYGVSAPRNIRGVATADEEKILMDEGIELLKVPMLKKSTDSETN